MRNLLKIFLILFSGIFLLKYHTYAQGNLMEQRQIKLDSIIKDLEKYPKNDTARISALWKVINFTLFKKEKEAVMTYYDEMIVLSRKLKNKKGELNCLLFKASYYKSSSDYKQAINYYDTIIEVINTTKDTSLRAVRAAAQFNKGQLLMRQENFNAALKYTFEALDYYTNHDPIFRTYCYVNIGNIFSKLQNDNKAIYYAKLVLETAEKYDVDGAYSKGILAITDLYLAQQMVDSAKIYLTILQPVMPNKDFPTETFSFYTKMGLIANKEKQFKVATGYFETALSYAIKSGHSNMKNEVYYYFSKNELDKGNLTAGKIMTDSVVSYAQKENNAENKKNAYELLSQYYAKSGNYTLAFSFLEKYNFLKDSLTSVSSIKQANILSAFYENSLKENQILTLQLNNEEQEKELTIKANKNRLLTLTLLGLSFVGFLGFRSYKTKQKLQQLKITELEKDNQILAVDALLKGQEDERGRLAKDLHDGLGGMLSGTKLAFMNIKENLILDDINMKAFEKSISQLDNSIIELRKVAHNLMPESLVKFGLKNSIFDYCNTIELQTNINIRFQQMGIERVLSNSINVNIYRIIQELVNNVIKHAKATSILIQLTIAPQKILILVEDDGIGLNQNRTNDVIGIGLKNVQQRVNYLKGNMAIESNLNEGTSILIELQT